MSEKVALTGADVMGADVMGAAIDGRLLDQGARLTHAATPLTAAVAEIHRMSTAAGHRGEDQAAPMAFIDGVDKERFA